jgi:integrase
VNHNVVLTIRNVTKADGRQYSYWQLRWYDANGRRHSQNIGRKQELSKRQASRIRQQKQRELDEKPIRRDLSRVPTLADFLDIYVESRRSELARGTLELHEQTIRYLKGYFGGHRRIDEIARYNAREFKTELSKGKLRGVNKRQHASMKPSTVDLHIRNARTIFNRAVDDDLIDVNPFDRLAGGVPPIEKNWHYVSLDELSTLLVASPSQAWKTLLGLCRLAGLRQGEALALQWSAIDWDANRISVWAMKTKRRRIVPIAPELLPILRDALEQAPEGEPAIVAGMATQNLWRDFRVICKRAGIKPYAKWCHTLRKNRESDWINSGFPFHVVVEWMGHSDEVARQHYLRVNEEDLAAATQTQIGVVRAQLWAQPTDSGRDQADEPDPQIISLEKFKKIAGDRIRTDDVQLGN